MTLIIPFALLRLVWKSRRNPAYRRNMGQRLSFKLPQLNQTIVIHAVSVGETMAAAPFIRQLLQNSMYRDILVTSTTPTGSDRVTELFGTKIEQCLLPFDQNIFVKRFLNAVKPALVIVVETEIWPNLIYHCHLRKIPVLLANARLSERSAKGYARISWLIKPTLARITTIATHASEDRQRFLQNGAVPTQVHVIGSIKFDLDLPLNLLSASNAVRNSLSLEQRFIWVAASTHAGEEEQVLKAAKLVQQTIPNALCVLIPRHAERFEAVARMLIQDRVPFQRHSQPKMMEPSIEVLLVDTMGELLTFYTLADAAFVGGSLVEVGGHNVLESLACETATLVGPHMFNFQSIYDMLSDYKAIVTVESSEQLAKQLCRFAQNQVLRDKLAARGLEVMRRNRGALDKLTALCTFLLATH